MRLFKHKNNILIILLLFICNTLLFVQEPIKSVFAVGLITDVLGIKDKGYNENTWKGILEIDASKFSLSSVDYYVPKSTKDYYDFMTEVCLFESLDLIVVASPVLRPILFRVANENPNSKFIVLDGIVDNANNIANSIFATEEGSFLVGLLAALKVKEDNLNKIAFIGENDNSDYQKYEAGFELGIKTINPNLSFDVYYLNGKTTKKYIRDLSTKIYNSGVNLIYNASTQIGDVVYQVARDRNKIFERELANKVPFSQRTYKYKFWVIGIDKDKFEEGIYETDKAGFFSSKSATLTSMVKKYNVAAYDLIAKTYNDAFPAGQVIYYNLKNNGVGIPEINTNLTFSYDKVLEEYKKKIINGEITITKTPSRIGKIEFINKN